MTERRMLEIVRNQRPLTLGSEATVAEACRRRHERRVGAVLVTDEGGRLLGIFTGRDAVRLLAEGRTGGERLHAAMTRNPETMPPGRTAIEALRSMQDGGFRHVPVVERGVVVGVASWGDFRGSEHDRLDVETGYWERI